LDAANSCASETRILLRTNLSFSLLLKKYLDSVLGAGFVRAEGSAHVCS
jgi:predicted transcriptional regulator